MLININLKFKMFNASSFAALGFSRYNSFRLRSGSQHVTFERFASRDQNVVILAVHLSRECLVLPPPSVFSQ